MKRIFFSLFVLLSGLKLSAQYTLTANDVSITPDGFITRCFYSFAVKNIVIPEKIGNVTVRGINNPDWGGVFENKGITNIQFPATLKVIGNRTFTRNPLTTVIIPDGVTHIGDDAFSDCTITDLKLPGSIIYLGREGFYGNAITKVVIPHSLKYLEDFIFSRNNIAELTLHDSVKYIGEEAFSINQIKKIILPPSVNYIGDAAFWENKIDTLVLSKNVRFIGHQAFSTNKLTSLKIPEGTELIGAYAFQYNDIDSLIIPSTVTQIMGNAFSYNSLTKVYYPAVSRLHSVDRGAYYTGDYLFRVDLPDSVNIEGYKVTGWHDNYNEYTTYVHDQYNYYTAKGAATGYLVSGTTNLGTDNETLLYIDGDFKQTVLANTNGTYEFRVNAGRSVTITPFQRGYVFSPQSIKLTNIRSDTPNQDFNFTKIPLGYVTGVEGYSVKVIRVYPNPATDIINVDGMEGSLYEMTDVSGKPVRTGTIINDHMQIDVSGLAAGMFFINMKKNNGEIYSGRFIKQQDGF